MGSNTTRRDFLKLLGATATSLTASACTPTNRDRASNTTDDSLAPAPEKMVFRTNPSTQDKVSLLGFGCMRLPTIGGGKGIEDKLDQDEINALVDAAIQRGVNYFDTAPVYCRGKSEEAMGIALKRHPRDKFFIATKLSNQSKEKHSREASMAIYENSFRALQVDTIDYMLLHSVGMGDEGGWATFESRFIHNGMLEFLIGERAKGKIRNLGFSYHGDVEVFDRLLKRHDDGELKWDFVQIQLNYVDWKHAKEVNARNTNAEYLYGELSQRGIPAIVMEPLLGGRLASLNFETIERLKGMNPANSIASWAFRFAGSLPEVLTVLSGMTYMENVRENAATYSPLIPLSDEEKDALEEAALSILQFPLIPCNTCQYCMPCPFGLDIPVIFEHYNKCLTEGRYSKSPMDENYARARQAFLVGYDRSVPKLRQADRCIGCKECMSHCPQRIDIPAQMARIDRYVELLKTQKPKAPKGRG